MNATASRRASRVFVSAYHCRSRCSASVSGHSIPGTVHECERAVPPRRERQQAQVPSGGLTCIWESISGLGDDGSQATSINYTYYCSFGPICSTRMLNWTEHGLLTACAVVDCISRRAPHKATSQRVGGLNLPALFFFSTEFPRFTRPHSQHRIYKAVIEEPLDKQQLGVISK